MHIFPPLFFSFLQSLICNDFYKIIERLHDEIPLFLPGMPFSHPYVGRWEKCPIYIGKEICNNEPNFSNSELEFQHFK